MEMLHPEWSYQAVLYEMNVRQLTAEGMMRVYPIGVEGRKGSLGSYYSVRDYCAVDPCLGTMEDFDAFVAEAHRLGMKVLLDWIANHTARDARWVTEKPASWYERDASGAPAVPWDWTDTAKLNYAEREVWRAQGDAMEFWVREHGVDGFRCDMAMLVPIEFWNETAQRLRRVKPDLFMLAEAEETYLFDGGAFDACYAWEMHHLMNDVAQQRVRVTSLRDYIYADRDPLPAYGSNPFSEFYRRLTALRHANPALASGERGGEMIEIRNNAEDCLMIAVREAEGNCVVAVMNLSPYAIHADYYTGIYAGMYTDAMTGRPGELRGHVEEDMAPWSYRILTR